MWNNSCLWNNNEDVEMAGENDVDNYIKNNNLTKPIKKQLEIPSSHSFDKKKQFYRIVNENKKSRVKCQFCHVVLVNGAQSRLDAHQRKCSKNTANDKSIYEIFQFDRFKTERYKYGAKCRCCQIIYQRPSKQRLIDHRRCCNLPEGMLSQEAKKILDENAKLIASNNDKVNESALDGFNAIDNAFDSQMPQNYFVEFPRDSLSSQLILHTASSSRMHDHKKECLVSPGQKSSTIVSNSTATADYVLDQSIVKQEISIVDVQEEELDPLLSPITVSDWPKPQLKIPNCRTVNPIRNIKRPCTLSKRQAVRVHNPALQKSSNSSVSFINQAKTDLLLAKFFDHCDIPLNITESKHFKAFVRELNPKYVIPSPDTLSMHLVASKISLHQNSQPRNGLELYDNFDHFVCKLPKKTYENVKLSKNYLWHALCLSQTENTLVQNLIKENRKFIETIADSMDGIDLDQEKRDGNNGSEINRFDKDNFCSYRSLLVASVENPPYIENMSELFDSQEKTKNILTIFDTISTLIVRNEDINFTIADVTEELVILKEAINPNNSIIDKFIINQSKSALYKAALCANYLHPVYRGALLSDEQKAMVDDYLLSELDASGLESFIQFNENVGLFGTLNQKNIKSVDIFWYFVKRDHGSLYDLAIKVLKIPAHAYLEQMWNR